MRRTRRQLRCTVDLNVVVATSIVACSASGSSSSQDGTSSAGPTSASFGSEPTIEMLGYAQSDPFWQIVGNFDVTPAGINDIVNGSMLMTIDQQGYLQGYDSVQMGVQYNKYGLRPVDALITGPSSISSSNVQTVINAEKNYPKTRGSV